MTSEKVSVKRKAVTLRLSGKTIKEVQESTGLSNPTIIKLSQAFKEGGWPAVDRRLPGRPSQKDWLKTQSHLDTPWGEVMHKLLLTKPEAVDSSYSLWTTELMAQWLSQELQKPINARGAARLLREWGWVPDHNNPNAHFLPAEEKQAAPQKLPLFSGGNAPLPQKAFKGFCLLYAHNRRGKLYWLPISNPISDEAYVDFMQRLVNTTGVGAAVKWHFAGLQYTPKLRAFIESQSDKLVLFTQTNIDKISNKDTQPLGKKVVEKKDSLKKTHSLGSNTLTHLQRLEAESIHIMREVVAEAENPVMLYSIGKDSAVMLHLALKAFYPAKLPFPLLHVDTTWKFRDMYAFREQMTKDHGFDLITHINADGVAQGINPFTHGSQIHTDIMKTQGLKQALDKYGFDVAFGGARRDEEKSRAKERIFSFRNAQHHWDPKQQRPELWNLFNTKKHKGESIRVFPISNWTELDIWQYIYLENIPIVPLYYAQERPVVERDGTLIMVDDDRMPLAPNEVPMMKKVRFRTLGCYPLTGAVESQASTLPEIIQEMLLTKTSERQGRIIDHDGAASMEKKKQEGYF